MAATVGEIISRRKLDKQNENFYTPGQYKAVAVEDTALLTYVDGVGQLIMMAGRKIESSPGVEEWVIVKPANVIMIALDGTMQIARFAPSYRFDERQVNAMEEALAQKSKKKADK